MARKPGPGICVHCLKDAKTRNWDHVFPQGWYPVSTPPNIEKWKIPSCIKCNREYGELEAEFAILLSACIDPRSAEASGIWEKTLRALDPSQGRDEKDSLARQRKKEKLLESILSGVKIPTEGIFPGLGERWGRAREDQRALYVPARYPHRLAEKIVRGLAFLNEGVLIGPEFEIEMHPVTSEGSRPIEEVLARYGARHHRGPGVDVLRAVAEQEPRASLTKITIWGELVLYATVTLRDAQQAPPGDRLRGA
jgi:hypothetical protein